MLPNPAQRIKTGDISPSVGTEDVTQFSTPEPVVDGETFDVDGFNIIELSGVI